MRYLFNFSFLFALAVFGLACSSSSSEPRSQLLETKMSLFKDNQTVSDPEVITAITIDGIPEDKENKSKNIDELVGSIKVLSDKAKAKGARFITRIIIDPADADPGLPYNSDEQYENLEEIKGNIARYGKAVEKITAAGSEVMVELADSHDMYVLRRDGALGQKARVYLKALGQVKLWEIGNEVNGEWTGLCDKNTKSVKTLKKTCEQIDDAVEKIKTAPDEQKRQQAFVTRQIVDAYKEVHSAGKQTALTLYYNSDGSGNECIEINGYDVDSWVQTNLQNTPLKDGLSYVFLSFYEDDCAEIKTARLKKDASGKITNLTEIKRDTDKWATTFNNLAAAFAPAKVGFGEMAPRCKIESCGFNKKKDDTSKVNRACDECVKEQNEFIERYYSVYQNEIKAKVPAFVSGYFYWYFYQDVYKSKRKPALDYLKNNL